MTRNDKFKLIGIPLVGALVLYFGGYFGVEYLRHRKGSWEVEFFATNGAPALRIAQPFLGVSNVVLVLEGETAAHFTNQAPMIFNDPRNTPYPVTYGRVIFEDLTFLPGTVTFDLAGHGIELLPRLLILNKRQIEWRSNQTLTLAPGEKTHPITPAEHKERMKALGKRSN